MSGRTTSTPPGSSTTMADVLEVLDAAAGAGATVWLDGGWGVDALLGTQTREHGDLDLAVLSPGCEAFVDALRRNGFAPVGEAGATAWNFLMARPGGAVIDLHVIELDADGNGVLGPVSAGAVYPASALTGEGVVGDRAVRCISAAAVVRFHDSYAGDAKDRTDVRALCERFDLEIPAQYRD